LTIHAIVEKLIIGAEDLPAEVRIATGGSMELSVNALHEDAAFMLGWGDQGTLKSPRRLDEWDRGYTLVSVGRSAATSAGRAIGRRGLK
jgi:hypothetical protein